MPRMTKTRRFIAQSLKQETDECILWPYSLTSNGYPNVGRSWGGIHQNELVTRIVCQKIHGPAPTGFDAGHKEGCRGKHCINKRHLTWQTRSVNMKQMFDEKRNRSKGADNEDSNEPANQE